MRLVAARAEATQYALPPLFPSPPLPLLFCHSAVAPLPPPFTPSLSCLEAIAQAQMLQVKVDLSVACLTNVRRQQRVESVEGVGGVEVKGRRLGELVFAV